MNRGRFTIDASGKCVPYVEQKRDVNAPYVVTDEIPGGVKSMADSRMYTSKRRLRDSYRRLGKVEMGNDWLYEPKPQPDPKREAQLAADVERAYYQCRDNQAPLSELDKERCKIIDRQRQHYIYDNRDRDEDGNVIE